MGERVVITGCSSGVGRAAAVLLARRGYEVVATARDPRTLDDLDVHLRLPLDVTDGASVAAAVEAAGRIDALVNNAGVGAWGPIELMAVEDVWRVMETNFLGSVRMVQAVLPQMRARRSGRIVAVSSAAGRRVSPLVGFYCASKYALEAMTEALRYEVAPFGIWVANVEPGAVESRFGENRVMVTDPGGPYADLIARAQGALRASRGEAATSEEVAEAVLLALEDPAPPLHQPQGEQARRIIAARLGMTDDEYERATLERAGLTDARR